VHIHKYFEKKVSTKCLQPSDFPRMMQ